MGRSGLLRGRSVGDELVYVAIGSAEVLPGRPRFAQQLDTGTSQLADGRWQVTYSEAGNRAGTEMLLARAAGAKYLDVAAVWELEDPEIRFGVHQPEPKNVFLEVRQLPGATGPRTAPAKPRDLHACQYQHHSARTARIQQPHPLMPHTARSPTVVERLPGSHPLTAAPGLVGAQHHAG